MAASSWSDFFSHSQLRPRAHRRSTDHAAAYEQLGSILVEQGSFEEAAESYRSLIGVRPSAGAHQKLAEVLMRIGRVEKAQREMEMARALGGKPGAGR